MKIGLPGKLGLSGHLTQAAIRSPITPLFLMAALVAGLIAIATIAREEEPQISVPMVDIMVDANGMPAQDVLDLVTKPLEAIVKGINGVEHVYSQTLDDHVMVTARFVVGTKEDDAVLRVHERIRGNYAQMPTGIREPLIVKHGINDVAIVTLTLSPKPGMGNRWDGASLAKLAEKLRLEMTKVDNIGLTYIEGSPLDEVRVEPDPVKLALYGLDMEQVTAKIREANQTILAGMSRDQGQYRAVRVGQSLTGKPDIGLLMLTTRDGRPVYVRDVATVTVGAGLDEHRVWSEAKSDQGVWLRTPAATVALAKRAGANAVVVSHDILARLDSLKGTLIPGDVVVTVTRDYGGTANDKANELLFHLGLATLSIVGLILVSIGKREALVTLVVIPTTILLTMFASELMGYTINRVSLFALIFSIGILVDDAIVVVENIARHWAMKDGRDRMAAAIAAVAEVGNPTVIATLTVVAALLPMLFVSGLMGPYMAPIPANATAAMLFSFVVAMVIAPWLMLKLSPYASASASRHGQESHESHDGGALGRLYRRASTPILSSRRRAGWFLAGVGIATVLACSLFATKSVAVKLLPFDNKSEIAVVLDLPRGSSLEETERVLFQAADIARGLPEAQSLQTYAGQPAPFNFNGLVRHYYLRQSPELGEIQVNLLPKSDRKRASHAIALDLRQRLHALALPPGSTLRVVEVPPGPPVMATLLAEVYGPDAATRRAVAEQLKGIFAQIPSIVDIGDSYGVAAPQLKVTLLRDRLEHFGVEEAAVLSTLRAVLGDQRVGYSFEDGGQLDGRSPLDVVIALPKQDRAWGERLLTTPVPVAHPSGKHPRLTVELGELVSMTRGVGATAVYRRDGMSADMVMAELAGAYEAPIYGIFAVDDAIAAHDWGKLTPPKVLMHGQPTDESKVSVLWDGEWEITYVTFRDMGAAFGVAILGIYILVVAQFGSFKLPLVILTPVPLTLIGIVLGHWMFNAPFTATSMIGFIALAGIIVRNSILLVDFIRHGQGSNKTLRQILIEAGSVRFKPILLTALSAMIGAATILSDPIFQGLALSLLFGLASSTLLTLLVIPAIYVTLRDADAIR